MAKRNRRLLARARTMRSDPTRGELRLWEALRRTQLGVRFRRQEPLGPYIADFVCYSHRLVVEVDGISHADGDDRYAQRRDRWLRERGWTVVHLSDEYVIRNLEGALTTISEVLKDPGRAWDLD